MGSERQSHFLNASKSSQYAIEMQDRLINGGKTDNLSCPAIMLPDKFDAYLDQLSKNTRQKMRRFLRKLDAGEVLVRAGTVNDLPIFEQLWTKQWPRQSSVDRKVKKYTAILAAEFARITLDMPVLTGPDGRIFGMLANFLDRVRAESLFFVSARDPEISAWPVSMILQADSIRHAIADGFKRYDFLRGDEKYKLDLRGEIEAISHPVIRRRSSCPDTDLLSPHEATVSATEGRKAYCCAKL